MLDLRFLFVMSLMLTVFTQSHLAQEQKTDVLRNLKITIHMDKQPLGMVFRYLMEQYDVPIGFEQATLDNSHSEYNFDTNVPTTGTKNMIMSDGKTRATVTTSRIFTAKNRPITINCEGSSLGEVMNIIVRQMENYTWAIDDGVVNIFPKRARDERFEKLLRTRIANFAVEKGRPVRAITEAIIALPEFQSFLKENNIYFTGQRGGSELLIKAQYGRPLLNDVRLSNVTFKELLNETTKIKRGGWRLRMKLYSSPEAEQIDIDI